ncbi:hypothetical protein J8I87_09495 [Paraburkholderia sp. LEh10]|nr:hypothetical protein [Paraburkholderia sp. LEh10]
MFHPDRKLFYFSSRRGNYMKTLSPRKWV